jgi:hypothetical protein
MNLATVDAHTLLEPKFGAFEFDLRKFKLLHTIRLSLKLHLTTTVALRGTRIKCDYFHIRSVQQRSVMTRVAWLPTALSLHPARKTAQACTGRLLIRPLFAGRETGVARIGVEPFLKGSDFSLKTFPFTDQLSIGCLKSHAL